jgi:cyanophycinase
MTERATGPGTKGTVALVGAGEFLPALEQVDRALLARLAAPARVVILPTASAPDGPGVPERWARMGVEHFTRLGAEVEPVLLLTREDASNPAVVEQIAAANFVYLSGGKPRFLLDTLRGTPAWDAILRVYRTGGVIAGCSAGAMVLGAVIVDFPRLWSTLPALSLVPGVLVIPHFDEMPPGMTALSGVARHRATVVGIDRSTALVGYGGRYAVAGSGGVTVFAPEGKVRYRDGQDVALPTLPPTE